MTSIYRFALNRRPTLEPLEDRTLMSTCHVTRLSDSGVGKGFRGDLRYCINKVNAEPGPDAIDFTVTGTINLTGILPSISEALGIAGPGADQLVIRRDSGGDYRILTVASGVSVEIYSVTITNGLSSLGGGINNAGILTLADVVVAENQTKSPSNQGGGIYNSGTLLAYTTSIQDNNAFSGGGGIFNAGGPLTLIHSKLTGNSSGSSGGGGILNSAGSIVTLEDSEISGNTASEGGGIENEGTITVIRSTFSGNVASPNGGAGILNERIATIRDSTIRDNIAATGRGGGIHNRFAFELTLENSTIAGNHANDGGGIFNTAGGGELNIAYSTIARNVADDQGGGIHGACGGCFNHFRNTIVAENAAGLFYPDFKGWLNSSSFNVFGNSNGGQNFDDTDFLDTDPMLGPLADNGGPTLTIELLPGSPAIDAGDNTDAPEFDQRGPGFPRIVNGTIDIGAFEVQASPIPDTSSPTRSTASLVSSLVYKASRAAVLGPPLTAGLATLPATASPFMGFLDVRLEPPDANGSSQTARSPINGANQNDTDWSTRPQRRAYYRPAESPVNGARPDPTADLDAIT